MRPSTLAPHRRALALRVLSAAVLLAGYGDLVRGGVTAAPLLLVLGYAILVPAVILSWS